MPFARRVTAIAVVVIVVGLTVRAGAGRAVPQSVTTATPVFRFHHVHLNSVDPDKAIDFYAAHFNAIYPELSKSFSVPLYRFFLEGVAADTKLNQADGIHPTADGVDIVVKNILPTVEALLGTISGQRS